MDKGQSELTDKIRCAIKKKLIEINAFVDDELPDYIMILVANKRSKAHMEKDLTLFLGKDTAEFTNWLWELVNNLKVSSKPKQDGKESKRDEETTKKDNSDEDVDVLAYDLGEQECDLEQDDNSLDSRPLIADRSEVSKVATSMQISAPSASVFIKTTDVKKESPKAKVYPVQAVARVHPSSTSKPVSRKAHQDEYDPMKPEFTGSVSSVVHVSQRKHPRPALQANKLLLRAMNDATKSVLDGKSIRDYYKPTPINVLSSNKEENNISSGLYDPVVRKIETRLDLNPEINIEYVEPSNFSENSNSSNVNILESEHYVLSQPSHVNRTICLPTVNTDLEIDNRSSSLVEEKSNSPHFIVTLDGVDFSSFKRKFSDDSDESMEVDEELFPTGADTNNSAIVKKQKIIERCKYWPACKNSDNCVYHHPTITCKRFPDCKYGDKCLYIHPNCKFDSLCTKKDCPFTHASKRTFQPQPMPIKVWKPKIICKYYPKCTAKNCPFIHPKLCRYGSKCRLPVCPYSHFNIPSRSQLKWKADASLNL